MAEMFDQDSVLYSDYDDSDDESKKELLELELPIPVTFDKIHKKVDREREEYLANKKDGNIRPKKEDDILDRVSAHVLNNPPCRRLVKAAFAEEKAQELYPAERDVHGLALYGGYKIKTDPVDFNYCTLKIDSNSWQQASAPKLYKSSRPLGKDEEKEDKPLEVTSFTLQPESDFAKPLAELSQSFSQYSSMRSTVERIPASTSVSPHCTPANVGPGSYDVATSMVKTKRKQKYASSMFRSRSSRFPGGHQDSSSLGYSSIAEDRRAWTNKGSKFEDSKRQLVSREKKLIPGPGSHMLLRWPKSDPRLYSSPEKVCGHAGFYSRGVSAGPTSGLHHDNSSLHAKTMTIE